MSPTNYKNTRPVRDRELSSAKDSTTKQREFSSNGIKIIGFDLDQTLYPKSPEIDEAIQQYIYEKISEKLNIDREMAKEKFDGLYQKGKGLSGSRTLMTFGFERDVAKNIVQEALENADAILNFLVPDKKVANFLEKMKNKYGSIDLITGSNKNSTRRKLEKLDIPIELFSYVITSDDGSKSDLSALRIWLDYYPNYKPENFLYIGDRVSSDFEKPKELGIKSILVNIVEPDKTVDCLQLQSLTDLKKYL